VERRGCGRPAAGEPLVGAAVEARVGVAWFIEEEEQLKKMNSCRRCNRALVTVATPAR